MLRSLLATGAVAAAAAAAAPLHGAFQTVIRNAPAPQLDGTWRLTFQNGGRYTTARNGVVLVRGSDTQAAATITFRDESGPAACTGSQATATYRWSLSGGSLSLTPVRESCAGRRVVLTTHALKKIG
jgi:hypothetical protein